MKNEEVFIDTSKLASPQTTTTVRDRSNDRVIFQGYDITNYKTWKEFEQIVTDQANQIRSLEEQVKNAIVPEFNIGQVVWAVEEHWSVDKGTYFEINQRTIDWFKVYKVNKNFSKASIAYRCKQGRYGKVYLYFKKNLFATREEAEKRLAELKGEKSNG